MLRGMRDLLCFVSKQITIGPKSLGTCIRRVTTIRVLYMSFDKFLLAVESPDLSQADKSIIGVSSFTKPDDG